ncbi:O-antigen ligase family protein [Candidatus Gottesmanbacteria bacterium]|nr:O-antigen ligase family protein [Candidatus Gottesmanbacteria bacterium]
MGSLPRRIFLATVFLYIALWFAPTKWIAFLTIGLYGVWTFRMLQSVSEALLVSYIALLPVTIGKQFPITLVSASQLNIIGRSLGIAADVVITGREVIVGIMALSIISQSLKQKRWPIPYDGFGWSLVILPVILFISTFFGSVLPWVSFFHVLFFIEPFILYTYITSKRVGRPTVLLAALIAAVGFESVLVLLQNIKGATIGLVVEDFPDYIPVDLSRDVSGAAIRLGGTFAHANILAHYLIFSLIMMLPIVFDATSSLSFIAAIVSTAGIVALIFTESRSAWFGWLTGLLVFFYLAEKVWHMRLRLPKGIWRVTIISAPILAAIAATVVIPRIAGTAYTFEPFGSAETRQLLFREATSAIRAHPLFGVGIAVDVYYMFLHGSPGSRTSVISYFPEPVHNGFIELFVQSGIIGFVAYLFCWGLLFREILRHMKKARGLNCLYDIGFFAALMSTMVNAQLQPLAPNLSVAVLFLMSWRTIDAQKPQEG